MFGKISRILYILALMYQMEENGQLHRINRTTYKNLSYKGDENDFINAAAYVPDSVICLRSAARYDELTNFLPDVIDAAIDRKKKERERIQGLAREAVSSGFSSKRMRRSGHLDRTIKH